MTTQPAFSPVRPDPARVSLEEFQEQLIRGLTHRMNNILSLFHGYLGLLMDDKKLDSVARAGLAKIKEGARAASDLMERTNALVRPMSTICRDINLADLIRQLRPHVESFCSSGMRLEIECADDLPHVWADASRVRLALTELVRNACEAARERVRITVTATSGRVQGELFASSENVPKHWLTIGITDDGAGIPIERADRVYQPFYTTKTKQNAAGLGLTVAIGCAQQLKGTLQHRSRPGETTFELVLPSGIPQEQDVALAAME
jgi:two-component system, cell cycle sensor histidine kinase and response regulator CckA